MGVGGDLALQGIRRMKRRTPSWNTLKLYVGAAGAETRRAVREPEGGGRGPFEVTQAL